MRSVHRISQEDSSILSVAVSEKYVFAGTQNHTITVHDLKTFSYVTNLSGHNSSVLSLKLTPDDSKLFSSSGDSIIRVWSTKTFKCLHVIYSSYDVGDIFSTAYSANHNTLYLGSQNTSLQWIDFSSDRPVPSRDTYPTRRPNKFFDSTGPSGRSAMPNGPNSGRGRRISATGDIDSRILMEIDKDDVIQYAHYSYVYCLLIGAVDGEEVLFSGGGDAAINIWALEGRPKQIKSLCQSAGAAVLALAQYETMLYAGHSRGTISIWDLETCQLLRRLQAHEGDVQALSITSRHLVSLGGSEVKMWQSASGMELLDVQPAHAGKSLCSATSPLHDDLVVTGGNDNDIIIWDSRHVEEVDGPEASCPTRSKLNEQRESGFMYALKKLVSYKSISGSSDHVEDCRRTASYLRSLAAELGAEASLIPTTHNPIVLIKFSANQRPRSSKSSLSSSEAVSNSQHVRNVLYYGHYDVISADDNIWKTNPWILTGHNGFLYGRGISDNKAPILSALFAAHELLVSQSLAINLTFLIEGEEENGSLGFKEAIKQSRSSGTLGDFEEVFLSNSYWLDDHVPCLTYGLRGVIHASVTVSNDLPDLHSGVEGGSVREPTIDLVNLLAKLTNDTGAIALPDFYTPVRRVDDEERRFYEDIAKSQLSNPPCATSRTKVRHAAYQSTKDDSSLGTSKEEDVVVEDLMNRWCRPSLTIHKVSVSGPGNSTIIPHSASAKISMRIVPDQTLEVISEQLVRHLTDAFARFNSPNRLQVKIESSSDWWLSPPTSASFVRLSGLIGEEWGTKPLMVREGGSIPMVRWLEREFHATAVHFPMGQSSDSAHLVDERLRILNLDKGRNIMKSYFSSVI